MVDLVTTARFGYRTAFVGLAALFLFLRILPLGALPPAWPGPDLLLCLTIVWVLRRPNYVPVGLIVVVFLVDDLVTGRPPGLWTLVALLGTEFLRSRAVLTRDLPFVIEWLMAGAVIMAMSLSYRAIMLVFMVPMTGLGPVLLQYLSTMIAYPAVVVASAWVLGLRKTAPGQVDALGHKL